MDINEEKTDLVCHISDPSITTQLPDALIRSEGELSSVQARQKKVREALQKLDANIQKDEEPPVIALLASGGGLRSMVGLLGVLTALAKEGILDAITYITGTSGSTWCMSSLYNNEKWSSCMEEMEHQIADRLVNFSGSRKRAWEKLQQTVGEETYSLTNFWAYVFIHKVIREIDEKTLSNHQTSCESGENPYPVYSAVEDTLLNLNQPGAWFEFTPHLAGFPAYKTFVKTELLGSQFREGKLVKNHPEKDLCFLQGLWGSAPADKTTTKNIIHDKIRRLFPIIPSQRDLFHSSYKSWEESFNVKRFSLPNTEGSLDSEGTCSCNGCHKLEAFLSCHDLSEITDTELDMLLGVQSRILGDFCEKVNLIRNTLKCLVHWQWGTINNFLYGWSSNIPGDLHKKEFLSLVDAGLEINSAYPLLLPPNRKVDLILSFDYSEGDPFMTLKQTDEYCRINGVPFPKMNIEDTESEAPSQSCYVFEGDGKGAPDVMHFPLFNNQSVEGKIPEFRKKYATTNLSYDESDLSELLKVSKLNVELNKDQILEKVKKLKCK